MKSFSIETSQFPYNYNTDCFTGTKRQFLVCNEQIYKVFSLKSIPKSHSNTNAIPKFFLISLVIQD